MTHAELQAAADRFSEQLGEHADAILVCIAVPNDEERLQSTVMSGSGLWNSRIALAHDFITWEQAQRLAYHLKNAQDEL